MRTTFSYLHHLIIKCSICYFLGNWNHIMYKQIQSIIHLLKMTKQDNYLFPIPATLQKKKIQYFVYDSFFSLWITSVLGLKNEFSLPWRSLLADNYPFLSSYFSTKIQESCGAYLYVHKILFIILKLCWSS